MAHDRVPMIGRRLATMPNVLRSRWIGPVATVAAVVLILLARSFVTVTSPGLVLLVFVAISAVLGGLTSALLSAAITVAFVLVDASVPDHLFQYDTAALSRLILIVGTTLVMAVLVGGIQQRLQAQLELLASQRSEDRQRALTDPASEAIITIDTNSVILGANPATSELFGYPTSEIVGGSITQIRFSIPKRPPGSPIA